MMFHKIVILSVNDQENGANIGAPGTKIWNWLKLVKSQLLVDNERGDDV